MLLVQGPSDKGSSKHSSTSASTRSATGREDSNSCLSGILLCTAAILFSSATLWYSSATVFWRQITFSLHLAGKTCVLCCVLSNLIFQIRKSLSCIRCKYSGGLVAKHLEILSRLSRHWRSLQSYLSLHLNCTSEQILSAEEKDCLTRYRKSR